jgi:hypothetical protein
MLTRAQDNAAEDYQGHDLGPHFRHGDSNNPLRKLTSAFYIRDVLTMFNTVSDIANTIICVAEPLGFVTSKRYCARLPGLLADLKMVRDWRTTKEITTEMQHILVQDLLKEEDLPRFVTALLLEAEISAKSFPLTQREMLGSALLKAIFMVLGLNDPFENEVSIDIPKPRRSMTWPL